MNCPVAKLTLIVSVVLSSAACAGTTDVDEEVAPLPEDNGVDIQKSGSGGGGGGTTPSAGATFQSFTVTPAPLPGGHPASGLIAFSGATSGVLYRLVSSNPAVLTVPFEAVVPAQQSKVWFNVVTTAVTAPTTVTISATSVTDGVRTAAVTVVPATAPPVPDQVAIQSARWSFVSGRGGNLVVNATSSNPNAILTVYFPPNSLAFTLTNNGGGSFSATKPWTTPPTQLFVKSNFLGVSPTVTVQR